MEQEVRVEVDCFYECATCGATIKLNIDQDIQNQKCLCGKPNYKFLKADYTEDGLNSLKYDLGLCYEEIQNFIKSYMDMPESQIKLVSMWIIGTYFHSAFPTFPFLFINAMRGSGKTRLLEIIANLANGADGQVQTGATESILFRAGIHKTLIFDEFESIGGKDKAVLREYLNACYKSGGVVNRMRKVRKQDGEGFEIEKFEPYKPIAMANIWGMEEVLGDRCLTIILEKSNNPAKTKKMQNFQRNVTLENIKRTLKRVSDVLCCYVSLQEHIKGWNGYVDERYNIISSYISLTSLNVISSSKSQSRNLDNDEIYRKIDETNINARNLELFFPLLIISNLLDYKIFEEMLKIGKDIIEKKSEEEFSESKDVSLIDFVSRKEISAFDYLAVKDLKNEFKIFLGDDDLEDKWLNNHWMGRALKRLGLILESKKVASGRIVILNVAKAKDKIKMFKQEEVKE